MELLYYGFCAIALLIIAGFVLRDAEDYVNDDEYDVEWEDEP